MAIVPALAVAMVAAGGALPAYAVMGGTTTTIDEAPFTVSIRGQLMVDGVLANSLCGGVQLSQYWVLTAKHCLDDLVSIDVYIGSSQQWAGTSFKIAQIVASPTADLALLKLATPAAGRYAKISVLPQIAQAQIFGWGREDSGETSPTSPILKSAYVNVTRMDQTVEDRGSAIATVKATGQAGGGDSGGPVVQRGAVIGIISANEISSWAGPNPVAYAVLLAHYIDWIDATVGFDTRAEQVEGVIPGVQLQSSSNRVLKTGNVGEDFAYGRMEDPNGSPYGWSLRTDYAGGIQLEAKNGMCLGIDTTVPGVFSKLSQCNLTDPNQKFQLVDTGQVDQNGVKQYYLQSMESGQCVQERPLALAITVRTGACGSQTRWRGISAGPESSQAYIDTTFASLAATRALNEETSSSRPPREAPPEISGPEDVTVAPGQPISWTAVIDQAGWQVQYFVQSPGGAWTSAGAALPSPQTFGYPASSVLPSLDQEQVKAVFTRAGETIETAPATIHVVIPTLSVG